MKDIIIPASYNYIAVFLTLGCNYNCSYCITHFGKVSLNDKKMINGARWVEGLNRIMPREDLPVTLQGGEPSMHKDFIYIINNLKPELKIDILTNLQFDVGEFIKRVKPGRIKRDAPYASLRISYHPEVMKPEEVLYRALRLQESGFSIGIWGVLHPEQERNILGVQEQARKKGLDFRVKEFLGYHNNTLYGTYKYKEAIERKTRKRCLCKTTELIVGPSGSVYRCHGDLYEGRAAIGSISDPDFQIREEFLDCDWFGYCNPCDIKVKTNRFQEFGHTSVEIKDIHC